MYVYSYSFLFFNLFDYVIFIAKNSHCHISPHHFLNLRWKKIWLCFLNNFHFELNTLTNVICFFHVCYELFAKYLEWLAVHSCRQFSSSFFYRWVMKKRKACLAHFPLSILEYFRRNNEYFIFHLLFSQLVMECYNAKHLFNKQFISKPEGKFEWSFFIYLLFKIDSYEWISSCNKNIG